MRVAYFKSLIHMTLVILAIGSIFWFGLLWTGQLKLDEPEIKIVPAFPVNTQDLAKFYDDPAAPVPPHASGKTGANLDSRLDTK